MKRLALLVPTLLVASPSLALGAGDTSENKGAFISDEWELHDWIPIHIGPLNLSINKAVAYLLLGALVSCVIGIVFMRSASRSTRSPRCRWPSRAFPPRRSGAVSRTSPR